MPFTGNHAGDIGLETPEGPVCKFDSAEGKIKSGEEIFEGGVAFFAEEVTGGDREMAEKLTRRNMKGLAYWQAHPFAQLEGPMASFAEFGEAMSKL